ncbi:MAG TPA: hypothetical protein PLV72_03280 [Candidatus Magasanikbacteria bacterium]|nr:hypothetical protein [Candidatus Magasanikbacteria bacterium]
MEKIKTLPFHESVAKMLRECTTVDRFYVLYDLIMHTTIPKGHDEIIAAIDECFQNLAKDTPMHIDAWKEFVREMKDDILTRKQAIMKAEEDRTVRENRRVEIAERASSMISFVGSLDPLATKGDEHI